MKKIKEYGQKSMEKFQTHFNEVIAYLSPEKIGKEYLDAKNTGDMGAAIHACAAYYRQKENWGIADFDEGDYSEKIAEEAVRGVMREVNIEWAFPDGRIQYLFNPTEANPPLNHEWLWQLNRHSFWPHMARAYAKSGDEKYAVAFEEQLLDWIAQTDAPEVWNGAGSAWRTIECGLRLMGSWQVAFNLFRHSQSVSDEALVLMIASMRRQAHHLIDHPTCGNWLMMESNGAYTFGTLYSEFTDAEEIRKIACERLTHELELQILPDGVHYELSPDYHVVTYSCATGLYKTARAFNKQGELPASYLEQIRKMAQASVGLSTPGFIQPLTNDTYVITTVRSTDFAEKMFPDISEFRFVNTKRKEGKAPEGKTASRFFSYAGFCVMRSDWGSEATYLNFDVGPLGMGHMHQDKLNINIYKGDEELIFDDGGGQYEHSRGRVYGTSAYDHNTVLVDGLPQNRSNPKKVDAPIDAHWLTNDSFDYARGIYDDGFGQEEKRLATHTREVRFFKPDFFCVYDTLSSVDGLPHEYEVRFHLDTTKVDPVPMFRGSCISDFGKKYDLLIVPISTNGEEESFPEWISGQTDPSYLGWYIARNTRSNHPATTVLRKAGKTLTHHFTTLLFPMSRGEAFPQIKVLDDGRIEVLFHGKQSLIDRTALDK